jgi:TRAP-type C4-dicarboxylate transport system permease small subunit
MGTIELTEFMMICAVLGMGQCALEKRHIKVDVVTEHLSRKVNSIIEIIVLIPGMILILILSWQGLVAGFFTLDFDVRSSLLEIPNFPFYVVLSISFIILCCAMISLIIRRTMELITK